MIRTGQDLVAGQLQAETRLGPRSLPAPAQLGSAGPAPGGTQRVRSRLRHIHGQALQREGPGLGVGFQVQPDAVGLNQNRTVRRAKLQPPMPLLHQDSRRHSFAQFGLHLQAGFLDLQPSRQKDAPHQQIRPGQTRRRHPRHTARFQVGNRSTGGRVRRGVPRRRGWHDRRDGRQVHRSGPHQKLRDDEFMVPEGFQIQLQNQMGHEGQCIARAEPG